MKAASNKTCLVACDAPGGVVLCKVSAPPAATIAAVLQLARQALPALDVDWDQGPTGVFGERLPREYVPGDGDRVELYRPLSADPRHRRRERVSAARARSRRAC